MQNCLLDWRNKYFFHHILKKFEIHEEKIICTVSQAFNIFYHASFKIKRRYWSQTLIWAPSSEFVSSSIPSWQILTAHAQSFRGARDLAFCLRVPLDSLLVWASSGGSGETARMRRLASTFAARIGDKYQIRLTRPIYLNNIWAEARQSLHKGICAERRRRSPWTSGRNVSTTLIRFRLFAGWPESSLGAHVISQVLSRGGPFAF